MYVLAVESLADDRFRSDLTVLNFFFDTPIITRITLEMRITVFDQISAVGGALGLFTGVSLITFAELVYWVVQFVFACVLAVGMSWSHIRRRMAGQFDTDDVDIDE